jgi:hypothetical protein
MRPCWYQEYTISRVEAEHIDNIQRCPIKRGKKQNSKMDMRIDFAEDLDADLMLFGIYISFLYLDGWKLNQN